MIINICRNNLLLTKELKCHSSCSWVLCFFNDPDLVLPTPVKHYYNAGDMWCALSIKTNFIALMFSGVALKAFSPAPGLRRSCLLLLSVHRCLLAALCLLLLFLLLWMLHLQVDVAGGGWAGGGGRGAVGRWVLGGRRGRRGGGGSGRGGPSLAVVLGQIFGPGGDQLLEVADPLQNTVQSR